MGWTALADDHHERGDLADLTPDGDRLFTLLITFTNTPQRKGKFTRLDAAQLARRKFPIDLDVALADLLSPDHPQIEEADGGFQIINSKQYHETPQKSVSGKKGGEATRDSGALAETRDKRWPEDDSLSRLKAGSKHSENVSKLSPSPSPVPSPSPFPVPDVSVTKERTERGQERPRHGRSDDFTDWAKKNGLIVDDIDEVVTALTEAGFDKPAEAIECLAAAIAMGKTPRSRKLTALVKYITNPNNDMPLASMASRYVAGEE